MARMMLPKRYLIVFLTFICTNVCYIERMGFPIAYTVAATSSGVDQSKKGLILSAFYYGYALSQIPGGWAAQHIGGRRVLLVSFITWSMACVLVPVDPNHFGALVLVRLLVGVAQGFIFPSIHNVLAQWVPPFERSRSVSLTTSGMYLGAAIGMLLLPSLVKCKGPQSVFLAEAALGAIWTILWLKFASDAPRSDHPKAAADGFGSITLPITNSNGTGSHENFNIQNSVNSAQVSMIPWKSILLNLSIWAILVNSFAFHYALYVLMNWLPTYFELGLKQSLQDMGSSKMLPYLNMFIFSNIGGTAADYAITRRILSVTKTRKFLNTLGFAVASVALLVLPSSKSSTGAILCSSIALGSLALGRAGFAVNHMDVAPKYAGIIMGFSNTAGTLAGVVGVGLTGKILDIAKNANLDLSSSESWKLVFHLPGYLCILSSIIFLIFSTGDRIF